MSNAAEIALTQTVLSRLGECGDPRLKTVMTSLITHLHDFVRDVRLTDQEWMQAIQFLTEVGKTCTPQRQEFILLSDTLGISTLVLEVNHPSVEGSLEATVLGPFYVEGVAERPLGADLTDGMEGEPTFYSGRVSDTEGRPIAEAVLDIWSSDGIGAYDVQRAGPFVSAGRAKIKTDADGRYWFRSIKPADYPVPTDGPAGALLRLLGREANRPGHLHLIVSAPNHEEVVTQLFVADSVYLNRDAVFGAKDALAGRFARHAPGVAPTGEMMTQPFYTVEFDMRLRRSA